MRMNWLEYRVQKSSGYQPKNFEDGDRTYFVCMTYLYVVENTTIRNSNI